jgi:hypothetical protein
MAGEYVQVHTTLLSHRKLKRLSRALEICPAMSRGHLVTLWLNCLMHAADGNLEDFSEDDIADYAEWPGDPAAFVAALVACQFVDETPSGLVLHDWEDFSGVLHMAKNRAYERNRKRAQREAAKRLKQESQNVSRGHPRDVPATSPDVPPRTEQNRTERNRTDLVVVVDRAREGTRDLDAEAFERILVNEHKCRWVPAKWAPLVSQLAPFSRQELDHAWATAREQATPGRPVQVGLVVRILESARMAAEAPAAPNPGPSPGSGPGAPLGPISRQGQVLQRAIAASNAGMFSGVLDIGRSSDDRG